MFLKANNKNRKNRSQNPHQHVKRIKVLNNTIRRINKNRKQAKLIKWWLHLLLCVKEPRRNNRCIWLNNCQLHLKDWVRRLAISFRKFVRNLWVYLRRKFRKDWGKRKVLSLLFLYKLSIYWVLLKVFRKKSDLHNRFLILWWLVFSLPISILISIDRLCKEC